MATLEPAVLEWLLAGDPAVRWQAMHDLLDAPDPVWEAEKAKIGVEGIGARLLAVQNPDGGWGEGLYSPKWTSTTYTLLLMRDLGFDGTSAQAAAGGKLILERLRSSRSETYGACTCVVGMWLALGLRFAPGDPIYERMVSHLLRVQFADGGWNCRWPRIPTTHHSSFHTTLNVIDGLQEAIKAGVGPTEELRSAESRAFELLLKHRMFRSDKTGAVINRHFTQFHFPPRWHYDVLRGLDSMRHCPSIRDPRLDEAFELVLEARRPDGRWSAAKTYAGKVFFNLEPGREGSRWNTLRALRCLRARQSR